MIAAAKPKSKPKDRRWTLDYTRRHVVVALLAAGRSRAQAAKYLRISPEVLQRVAECNSRFRYDMRKAEVDYQTRKARRRLRRSLVDHASPDFAAQAKAEAQAAQSIAQAEAAAARIKASLQNDGEEWLLENPEGRSMFYNRELPDLAELETLARLFPPLPPLPEFQPAEFQNPEFGFPRVDFDALSEIGEPSPAQVSEASAPASEACTESNPQPQAPSPALAPSFKEAMEAKAIARVRAEKTWQYFESRRKYRRVRIAAATRRRPINQRLRNAPNPKRPEIKTVVVCAPASAINAAPSPQPSPSGRGSNAQQRDVVADEGQRIASPRRELNVARGNLESLTPSPKPLVPSP